MAMRCLQMYNITNLENEESRTIKTNKEIHRIPNDFNKQHLMS